MDQLLLICDKQYQSIAQCCHKDSRLCNCFKCLDDGYNSMSDTYDCAKKMNAYVLNYGPSYVSEFYHYLSKSKILESLNDGMIINILSLGCGFGPDLAAIEKYLADNQLKIKFHYCGIDESSYWNAVQYQSANAKFVVDDVITSMDFTGYDLIIISKLFSTLYNDFNKALRFLKELKQKIKNTLRDEGVLVFHDVNSINLGRDYFHGSVLKLFSQCRQFHNGVSQKYTEEEWIKIPNNKVLFRKPSGVGHNPLPNLRQDIFFEYCK
jgi:SAM-dependent methyltransferase